MGVISKNDKGVFMTAGACWIKPLRHNSLSVYIIIRACHNTLYSDLCIK